MWYSTSGDLARHVGRCALADLADVYMCVVDMLAGILLLCCCFCVFFFYSIHNVSTKRIGAPYSLEVIMMMLLLNWLFCLSIIFIVQILVPHLYIVYIYVYIFVGMCVRFCVLFWAFVWWSA